MSFDRLIYDDRTYKENLKQSTSPLNYMMNPIRYRNCHKYRAEFGIVGGQDASLVEENMVDQLCVIYNTHQLIFGKITEDVNL